MSHDGPRFAFPTLGPAIRLLLIANAVVFVLNAVLLGRLSDSADGGSGAWFAFSCSGVLDGFGLGTLRLLSYQFTHSFRDPMHLVLNMAVLWFFGTMVEPRLGYRGTLKLYLCGGFAGALLHVGIAAAQGNANVPVVGASGACYAFLLHAACVAPRSTVILIVLPVPLWGLAALLVGLGLYSTFVEFATGFEGGVSHGAHLGGALLGFLSFRFGWFVDFRTPDRPGLFASWRDLLARRRRAAALHEASQRELQLDQILAKVKQQGLPSLTAAERRFLDRSSATARNRGS